MAINLQQAIDIGKYLVTQRLLGRKRFPLVLMLEPLFRCNLACTGCGKIQHPVEILKQNLTPEPFPEENHYYIRKSGKLLRV
jgi:MoaA/NifB/PqqE/SkfB family radical SAM enzyme